MTIDYAYKIAAIIGWVVCSVSIAYASYRISRD